MERKHKILRALVKVTQPTVILFTLLFCSCKSGQAVYQEQDTVEQRERNLTTLRMVIKVRQRIYCLSADIKVASDTKACFDCHDTIERK